MNAQIHTSTQTLNSLGSDVSKVATRSLELLKKIESTVEALCYNERIMSLFSSVAHDILESIQAETPKKMIDCDGTVAETLLLGQLATKTLYDSLESRHKAACDDVRLTHEDGVADGYQQLMNTVADLHDCLNALREAIGEHDADLDEPIGTFDSVEEMFAALK